MALLLENNNDTITDIIESDDDVELELNDVTELDNQNDWIENYIKKEEVFDKFYKEKLDNINVFFMFIDKQKNIIKLLKDKLSIENNLLKKDEILNIIKEKKNLLKQNFKLIQILKYNFNIDNMNINNFLNDKIELNYLNILHEINDIYLEDTIPLFKDLNSLYFIFHEKSLHNTKKIFLKQKKRKKRKKRKTKKNEMKELIIHKTDIIKIE